MCVSTRTRRRRGGFTLTEIAVTVLILSVVMGLVIPAFGYIRNRVRCKHAEIELQLIAAGVWQLVSDTGRWPGGVARQSTVGIEVWDLSTADAGLISMDDDFPHWSGPYVHQLPDDPWGNPYFFDQDYRVGPINRVVVGSFGPNGVGRNRYDSDDIYVPLD